MQMTPRGKKRQPPAPWKRILLLLGLLLSIALTSYSQPISLSVRQAPLEEVFRQIEAKTDYRFVYAREELKEARPVTLTVSSRNIEKILDLVFQGQPLSFTINKKYISVHLKVPQKEPARTAPQGIEVRGRVLGEGGEPLPGASVMVLGSTMAIATDEEGTFALPSVPPVSTLEVSSVGYGSRQVPLGGRSYLEITLTRSVTALDEAVVIAYGTVTRRYNTGSVSRVSGEEIHRQPVSNPLAALHGRAAGLTVTQANGLPGAAVKVQVRGRTSLNTSISNDPLFIIDGVPYTPGNEALNQLSSSLGSSGLSPFSSINPSDIESIEVLKDADATAIYGSRGANGVILITTKRGKAGKTTLEASVATSWSKVTRTMDMLGTPQYLQMRREALANDGLVPSAVPSNAGYAPDLTLWDTTRYTDFKKLLIGGTARTTDARASLSGGNAQTQFLVSSGYHRETTVYPGDFADSRATVHTSLNHRGVNKKFTLSLKNTYALDDNHLGATDMGLYINLPPNLPVLYEADGRLKWEEKGAAFQNPLALTLVRYRAQTEHVLSNLQLGFSPVEGLSFRASLGHHSLYVRERTVTPMAAQNPALSPLGSARFGNRHMQGLIAEPDVRYQTSRGRWKLEALLGASWQQNEDEGSFVLASGYTSDLLLESVASAPQLNAFSTNSRYRYAALFGRLNTQFRDRYILNLTARRDGSSRFGPGRRYASFGAVGGAWIFTREKFGKSLASVLSSGKLRGSYGTTGNDKIGDYGYLETYRYSGFAYQGASSLYPSGLFNPDYAWELNRKGEVALELGFLKDRLLFSTAVYRNRSSNQLVSYKLPAQTGGSSITANFPATVQNQGLELELSYRSPDSRKVFWQSSLNVSFPQNHLIAFPDLGSSSYSHLELGKSINIYGGLQVAGVNPLTGLYEFYDRDGKRTATPKSTDRINNLGSLDPDFYGGLSNSLAYKNWSLDLHLEFKKQRGKNYLGNIYSGVSYPGTMANQPVAVLRRWQQPGDGAPIQKYTSRAGSPAYTLSNLMRINGADIRNGDASYGRLKNLSLAYRLPDTLLRSVHLSGGRLYLQGQNLLTLTAYEGSDPESQELYRLPPLRTLSLGIQLTL